MEATTQAFDAARLREGPRASNTDPAPVFIVGMPRSGTTLTEQILDSHAEAYGAGERQALAPSFRALGGGWETPAAARRVARLGTPALDAEAERYLATLHVLAPDKRRIIDKMPGNFRLLGFAALLLPGARVIYCERDPRDIGPSIYASEVHTVSRWQVRRPINADGIGRWREYAEPLAPLIAELQAGGVPLDPPA